MQTVGEVLKDITNKIEDRFGIVLEFDDCYASSRKHGDTWMNDRVILIDDNYVLARFKMVEFETNSLSRMFAVGIEGYVHIRVFPHNDPSTHAETLNLEVDTSKEEGNNSYANFYTVRENGSHVSDKNIWSYVVNGRLIFDF